MSFTVYGFAGFVERYRICRQVDVRMAVGRFVRQENVAGIHDLFFGNVQAGVSSYEPRKRNVVLNKTRSASL